MFDYDNRGPTYWEGWWAKARGWSLHKDASESYRRGWLDRQALEKNYRGY